MFWSIYFKDPNNIPLEATWQFMEVENAPAMAEDDPLEIVAEGAEPQPGHWPEVTKPTPPERMVASAGNAYRMRQEFVASGAARFSDDFEETAPEADAAE